MTASRLAGKELSDTEWVEVQANWLGVDITEANKGWFLAPIQWVGQVGLIQWVFTFPLLTSSGTSGALVLKVPGLDRIPDQYCGTFEQRGASAPAAFPALFTISTGVKNIQTTMPLYQGRSTSLTATLSATTLNY